MDRISKFDCRTKRNTKFSVISLVHQYIGYLGVSKKFWAKKKLFQFKNFTQEPKAGWDLKNEFVSTVDNLQWNPFNDEKNGFLILCTSTGITKRICIHGERKFRRHSVFVSKTSTSIISRTKLPFTVNAL